MQNYDPELMLLSRTIASPTFAPDLRPINDNFNLNVHRALIAERDATLVARVKAHYMRTWDPQVIGPLLVRSVVFAYPNQLCAFFYGRMVEPNPLISYCGQTMTLVQHLIHFGHATTVWKKLMFFARHRPNFA